LQTIIKRQISNNHRKFEQDKRHSDNSDIERLRPW
jgi:hypothetical protein